MRVLLTGASSFTGLWFADKLRARGATIVAPLRGDPAAYTGIRGQRVRRLAQHAEIVGDCAFGGARFMELVGARDFDVLCHHAAEVGNYRSPDFDVLGAIAANTCNLRAVLTAMQARGTRAVVATGSVFEQDEGAGTQPLRAFSPYGLSKGLSWQIMRHECAAKAIPCGKFVIANPFGPYEEPRFGAYLIGIWQRGEVAQVCTPDYVRDNIHVDLLALVYADFVARLVERGKDARIAPSGYVETQGKFAQRFAAEFAPRLGLACAVALAVQADFSEPLVRINTDCAAHPGWNEIAAWDRYEREEGRRCW